MSENLTFNAACKALREGCTLVLRGHGWHDYYEQQGFKIRCSGFMGGREFADHPEYDHYQEWWDKEVASYLEEATLEIFDTARREVK